MYRVWKFLESYVWTLGLGTLLALFMANIAPELYSRLTAFPLMFGDLVGQDAGLWLDQYGTLFGIPDLGDVRHVLTVSDAVTKIGMSLFVALAAKELWEALVLKNGALRGRDAILPFGLALGGMAGAAAVYLILNAVFDLGATAGWAIPTNTDIAVAYIVGRAVFGARHPALRLLLLMALADDALSMLILALFHTQFMIQPIWLLVAVGAGAAAYGLANLLPRRIDGDKPMKPAQTAVRLRLGLLPYALAGALSLYAVARSGLHPALGLLPVLPAVPHANRAFGVFASAERFLHDLLNRAEQMLRYPVGVVLFLFAFCQAGVPLGAFGGLSLVVMIAMLLGKPSGVLVSGWIVPRLGVAQSADGIIPRVALVSGAGLTMSLLLADAAALSPDQSQAARLGVLAALLVMGVGARIAYGRRKA